jgi:6-phosphogluconolactonase (cycloisomerase 2 family)
MRTCPYVARALVVISLATLLGSCGDNGGGSVSGRVAYSIGGTMTGLLVGTKTPLTLLYTPSDPTQSAQTLQLSADGNWAFSPVPSGSSGSVSVKAQPAVLDQTCLLENASAGSTSQPSTSVTVRVASEPVTTIQVTCNLTPAFAANAVLSGLPTAPAGTTYNTYNVILYLTVTDIHGNQQVGKMTPPDGTPPNGTPFPFECGGAPPVPCQFTDGSTYQASIEQPTQTNGLIPESCVMTSQSARGVIAEKDIQIQVQCSPIGRFLYVVAGTDVATGTVVPLAINPKTGALTQNGAAVVTAVEPGTLSVLPPSTAVDPNHPPSTPGFAYLVNYQTSTLSGYSISYSSGAIAALNPASVSTPALPWEFGGVPALPFNGNFLYVTGNGGKQIQPYQINSSTGAVTAGTPVATGNNPWGNIVLVPGGKFAYQVNLNDATYQVFSIDPSTGALTMQGGPVSASAPLWLIVEPRGRFAYIQSYVAPKTVFWSYHIDSSTGQLSQVGQSIESGTAFGTYLWGAPAIDPSGTYMFSTNDNDNVVSVFQINADGTLASAPGSPFQPGYWQMPTNVVFSPGGRFVYILAHKTSNIAAYSVNLTPANGETALTLVGLYPTGGSTDTQGTFAYGADPNDLAIEPSGRFLYVCNGVSNTVSAFYIDANSGALSPVVGSPFSLPSGTVSPRDITIVP